MGNLQPAKSESKRHKQIVVCSVVTLGMHIHKFTKQNANRKLLKTINKNQGNKAALSYPYT